MAGFIYCTPYSTLVVKLGPTVKSRRSMIELTIQKKIKGARVSDGGVKGRYFLRMGLPRLRKPEGDSEPLWNGKRSWDPRMEQSAFGRLVRLGSVKRK